MPRDDDARQQPQQQLQLPPQQQGRVQKSILSAVSQLPLDVPPAALHALLAPLRERLAEKVATKMREYDQLSDFPRPSDYVHKCRDGYEDHLCTEGLKEVRKVMVGHLTSGPCPGQIWKIVGGEGRAGFVVREGPSLSSRIMAARLSPGSWVEEDELVGDHLRYSLIRGSGPEIGWIVFGGTALAERIGNVPRSLVAAGKQKHQPSAELVSRVSSMAGAAAGGEEVPQASAPPRIAIVALMAAHVKSWKRLDRLRHVLRSIASQDLAEVDAEFVVAVSWYAVAPDLADAANELLNSFVAEPSPGGTRVVVQQAERRSQFQHLGAALDAAEARLLGCRGGDRRASFSVWAMFGDDDDIWHSHRVGQYVGAIRAHPLQEGVGIFATTTRANIVEWKKFDIDEMPKTAAEVDSFLVRRHCKRLDKDEACVKWRDQLRAAGDRAAVLPVKPGLPLEYFDLCPRLRILREFLARTSPEVLAHRYCDLCFDEFIACYPRRGREVGLEVSFFEPSRPDCWMYFYANAGMSDFQLSLSIEAPGDLPVAFIGSDDGHVSTKVEVEMPDVQQANLACDLLQHYVPSTPYLKLTRYFAAFRNHLECFLIRVHGRRIDQRLLDYHVFQALKGSFETFKIETAKFECGWRRQARNALYKVCEDYAKEMCIKFGVGVLWHDPGKPLPVSQEEEDELGCTPWSTFLTAKAP